MKSIIIQNKSTLKVLRGEKELSEKDLLELPKGLTPGEWVILNDEVNHKNYIAYVNPYSQSFYKIKILSEDKERKINAMTKEEDVAKEIIENNLKSAIRKRSLFKDYAHGARIVYGLNDSLPGIIVDKYEKYIFAQINTAGMDRFRELIKKVLVEAFPNHHINFFDNVEYRKAEVLPIYDSEKITTPLTILENDIRYEISPEVMQKIGYYYDHRENRARMVRVLENLKINKAHGLDLFSYVGSWGLHLLKAGVEHVDFVDQANMEEIVLNHLKINKFDGLGKFYRADVFKFIEQAFNDGKKYNVIVSDPPAFTKSEKNKLAAIQGYEKLHLKAMKLLENESLFVAASCTHHVNFEELDKTVQDAALKNGQKIQLIDIGLQGKDHPFSGLKDKSFYIKYLAYFVTRG